MSIIRSMTAEDVAKVASLEAEIFSQPWSENAFLDSLCLPDTIFLVAEESGVIQGYIGMYLAADEGEITNVAVNPACRRRGIGEGLLTEMKKRAADHKIARIVLEVRVSNEGAIRVYEKQGFSSVGIPERRCQNYGLCPVIPCGIARRLNDIMNPDGFILEVPNEFRMRRKRRETDDRMENISMSRRNGVIYCNRCGSPICTEGEAGKSSFLTICKEWGYFSERKDGTVHRMDLCESCYDAWVRTFAIAPEVEQKTELI